MASLKEAGVSRQITIWTGVFPACVCPRLSVQTGKYWAEQVQGGYCPIFGSDTSLYSCNLNSVFHPDACSSRTLVKIGETSRKALWGLLEIQKICLAGKDSGSSVCFIVGRARGDMTTIYNSLGRAEKFDNRELFCLAVKTVRRSSGWKALTLILLDKR